MIATTLNDLDKDANGVVTVAKDLNALLEAEGYLVSVVMPANGTGFVDRMVKRVSYRLRTMAQRTGFSLLYYLYLKLVTSALAGRITALTVPPNIVIAHDALSAGVALRATGGTVPILLICHFGTEPWLEFANAGLLPEGTVGFRLLKKRMRTIMLHPRVDLVAVSQRNYALVRKMLPDLPPERIHIAYTGISLPEFPLLPEKRDPDDLPVIINVGRFDPWKNQRILPDVAAELAKRRVRCRFVLIGPDVDGEEGRVVKRCEELGVDQLFTFTGPLERAEVFRAMQCADLYLHTSRMESFGLTLVEAMASNLPVMALGYDTLTEVLPDTPEAIIPSDATPQEIAAAVAVFLEAPERRAELHARQRAVYDQRFSPEAFRKVYLDIIDLATRRKR